MKDFLVRQKNEIMESTYIKRRLKLQYIKQVINKTGYKTCIGMKLLTEYTNK